MSSHALFAIPSFNTWVRTVSGEERLINVLAFPCASSTEDLKSANEWVDAFQNYDASDFEYYLPNIFRCELQRLVSEQFEDLAFGSFDADEEEVRLRVGKVASANLMDWFPHGYSNVFRDIICDELDPTEFLRHSLKAAKNCDDVAIKMDSILEILPLYVGRPDRIAIISGDGLSIMPMLRQAALVSDVVLLEAEPSDEIESGILDGSFYVGSEIGPAAIVRW